jgi:hypothetical protein
MHTIDFDPIPWERPRPGLRFKRYERGGQRVRLMEFSEGFVEEECCLNGHMGRVLEGGFSIAYGGAIERYQAGDVFLIAPGEEDVHKAVVGRGERALVLLFETI